MAFFLRVSQLYLQSMISLGFLFIGTTEVMFVCFTCSGADLFCKGSRDGADKLPEIKARGLGKGNMHINFSL